MPTIKAVIFDFDFTLADSSKGIVECVNFALQNLGFVPPESQNIVSSIGLSLAETFCVCTGKQDDVLTEQFVKLFHQRADEVMDVQTKVYASVKPVMVKLQARNCSTAIVSTKLNYRIRSILAANQLDRLFNVVVGADDVKKTKPDPEGLLLALQQLMVNASSAVYVGDHVIDAQAASDARIPFVATLTGVHSRDAFQQYPYLAIVDSLEDIPRVLGLT